ncbi:MAG: hypothetical protein V2A79_14765 [Planctomycetota bacterium]
MRHYSVTREVPNSRNNYSKEVEAESAEDAIVQAAYGDVELVEGSLSPLDGQPDSACMETTLGGSVMAEPAEDKVQP